MISPNGTPPAPPSTSFSPRSQSTEFLPELPIDSWRMVLYMLTRTQWLGVPVIRWCYFLLIVLSVAWALFSLPGRWPVGLFWVLLVIALWIAVRAARRQHFAAFTAHHQDHPTAQRMAPAHKTPVYVTGMLGVEQKVREFTTIPGFYRSFATREHALLCRVQERRFLGVAHWPEDEIGLWYAFFMPEQIRLVQQGALHLSRQTLPALAVTYLPSASLGARRRSQRTPTTLYLAFLNQDDCAGVLADLLVEWQPTSQAGVTP